MEKIDGKSKKLKNLTPGGPGRPKGQRNYATIYREALIKIGEANNKTPEEIEEMMEQVGLQKAMKGNFQFWKDIRDRVHGKAQERHDHTSKGEKIMFIPSEIAEKNDIDTSTEGNS